MLQHIDNGLSTQHIVTTRAVENEIHPKPDSKSFKTCQEGHSNQIAATSNAFGASKNHNETPDDLESNGALLVTRLNT